MEDGEAHPPLAAEFKMTVAGTRIKRTTTYQHSRLWSSTKMYDAMSTSGEWVLPARAVHG